MKVENDVVQEDKESSNPVVDNYLSAKKRERYVGFQQLHILLQLVFSCYEARDRYFLCLDNVERRNGRQASYDGVDCIEEYRQYTNHCLSSWVRYFNQQRKIAQSKPRDFVPKQNK
ncbi:cytochrome-c oxidase-like protein isoform 2 [Galdieria sulphuraria]|uniref:Cytochrome-c oxidase-like protein isoform 2 n=1 Tax=Galdieria sulphuraria TaxID=130081 RepID=M2Y8P6_GALSU|nr:cytochrome-c oxidase-like protein isoform 2 [Galdieria sulphuraria]EME32214.1 cytochrome-c oxidase-like protein isoform 2 [Galdieria sulphuraria]|eukprot:XP_005708734.1 cytochrome-c oxidase-like protein isoform 2 [Galdieria sulphuraria]